MTKQFSNYSDLITFTHASKGHALRPVSYGDELVENGTFDSTPTGWLPADSTLASVAEELVVTNSVASQYGFCYQGVPTAVGKLYLFTIDITATSSNAIIRIGDDASGNLNKKEDVNRVGPDSIRSLFVATASTTYIRLGNYVNTLNATSNFDNVSLKEVLFDQPDGTLTLFEHPNNVPRVEYDADGNRLGLLVEEARTNLIGQSEFAGTWQENPALALSLNQGTSPDQKNNAAEVTITGGGFVYVNVAVNASTQYTFSWYAKLNTATAHVYAIYDNSNNTFIERTEYTLTDGEDVGNGWYRQSKTFTTPSGCTSIRVYPLRETADGGGSPTGVTGNTFIYGAQVEAGSFSTSYIKTTGSTATRSADVASIPVADFGYNQSEGTVTVEVDSLTDTLVGNPMAYQLNDGTTSERLTVFGSASSWRFVVTDGGAEQSSITGGTFGTAKIASSFEQNKFNHCVNGTLSAEDTSGTVPTVTKLEIGNQLNGNLLNGHIKSIKYYPRRLTNAQLQDLTS